MQMSGMNSTTSLRKFSELFSELKFPRCEDIFSLVAECPNVCVAALNKLNLISSPV